MTSISGTATFELTDLSQPNLLGTGMFQIQNGHLTDFRLNIAGLTFDESDMTGCQCSLSSIVLEGTNGIFIWDFDQSLFAVDFSAPGVSLFGTSEDGVSGVLTSNTLHAVDAATPSLFLFSALAIVILGRFLERRRP
jgi:hypothetical protein